MTNTLRRAIVFVMLALGLTVAACGGDSSVTGPTAIAPAAAPHDDHPTPPSGGEPFSGLAGEYTLTVTVDSVCADVPNDLRTRTYPARVTLSTYSKFGETNFEILVGGTRFLEGFDSQERFSFEVDHDLGIFHLGSLSGQPAFVEQLSATAYFAIGGVAHASVGPQFSLMSSIDASMVGYIEYCVMQSPDVFPVEGSPWKQYNCAPDKR
jgi:hypothetical protein